MAIRYYNKKVDENPRKIKIIFKEVINAYDFRARFMAFTNELILTGLCITCFSVNDGQMFLKSSTSNSKPVKTSILALGFICFISCTIARKGLTCKTRSCVEVLYGFATRGTRIIHNEYHFVVPYSEWNNLCSGCKRFLYSWYYEKMFYSPQKDTMPFELFEIEIEKEAAIDLWEYLSHVMHFSHDDTGMNE